MVFKPKPVQPDFARLYSILNNTNLQTKNNATYQVLFNLIKSVEQSQGVFKTDINDINNSINNSVSTTTIIINGIKDATVWTENDETLKLPSSIQVLAGTGITLDYSVPNKVTINGSSVIDHVVMSDGALPIPAPVDDGFGNFIYIPYTP